MSTREKTPTVAELELFEVHEFKAVDAGNDSCECRVCGRVRRYHEQHTNTSMWMAGGAL